MGIPGCGHSEDRKKRQDEGQSEGSQVGTGDPLAGLTRGVQCWRTRELRHSHVIFSIVFCTWVSSSALFPSHVGSDTAAARVTAVRRETAAL